MMQTSHLGKERNHEQQRQRIAHAAWVTLIRKQVQAGEEVSQVKRDRLVGQDEIERAHDRIHGAPFVSMQG
jgi:hypothetical protein